MTRWKMCPLLSSEGRWHGNVSMCALTPSSDGATNMLTSPDGFIRAPPPGVASCVQGCCMWTITLQVIASSQALVGYPLSLGIQLGSTLDA